MFRSIWLKAEVCLTISNPKTVDLQDYALGHSITTKTTIYRLKKKQKKTKKKTNNYLPEKLKSIIFITQK